MRVAAYTKSGGSWITWMLIDILHKPEYNCDTVAKSVLDDLIFKTEVPTVEAPTVHVIRHPLDVVCSAWNYMGLTNRSSTCTADEYFNTFLNTGVLPVFNNNRWMDFVTWGEQAEHQILYNDLVDNPSRELQKIVGDIDVSESVQKYSLETLREREKGVDATAMQRVTNKKYSFFNKASSFYYNEILTEEQINQGHKTFRKEIEKYWPETLWKLK
jgi:hypothetical protein